MRTVTVSLDCLTPLAAVTDRLLLETPCAADTAVWFLAGPAANTRRLVANSAARAPVGRLVTVLAADTAGFFLTTGSAVLLAGAGMIPAVTAAPAVTLLAGWTNALARGSPAGVATPWAGFFWRLADLAAAAVLTGPTAHSAAATRVVLD